MKRDVIKKERKNKQESEATDDTKHWSGVLHCITRHMEIMEHEKTHWRLEIFETWTWRRIEKISWAWTQHTKAKKGGKDWKRDKGNG